MTQDVVVAGGPVQILSPEESARINAVIDNSLGTFAKTVSAPSFQQKLVSLLPSHVKPEKFIQAAQIAALSNNAIQNANPASIMKALIQCASDGLMPDGREAALVPYKGQVQYQPMIDGVLKRLRMSGKVKKVMAHVVYANDRFDYGVNIDGEYLEHKPDLTAPRTKDNIVAVYAVAKLDNDEKVVEVMTREEVDRIARCSKSAFDPKTGQLKPDSVWMQHYDRMAIKTVLHRLCRRLPNASEVAQMLERDIQFDAELSRQQAVADARAQAEVQQIQVQAQAISPEQAETLRTLMHQAAVDEGRFCAFWAGQLGVPIQRIDELPVTSYEQAVQRLEARIEKRMAQAQQPQPAATPAPQMQQTTGGTVSGSKEAVLNALEGNPDMAAQAPQATIPLDVPAGETVEQPPF